MGLLGFHIFIGVIILGCLVGLFLWAMTERKKRLKLEEKLGIREL